MSSDVGLRWGLKPEGEFAAAWGAVAIYKGPHSIEERYAKTGRPLKRPRMIYQVMIDLPRDRQDAFGSQQDRRRLSDWLNKTALKQMKQALLDQHVYGDDIREISIRDGPYLLRASPRGSRKYLYMVATLAED